MSRRTLRALQNSFEISCSFASPGRYSFFRISRRSSHAAWEGHQISDAEAMLSNQVFKYG